jgi:uncharacterized protein
MLASFPPRTLLATVVLAAVSALGAGAAPLRVLILSGANNHDWRATTPVLRETLEAGGLATVEVTEQVAAVRPEDLGRFDVVLGNYNTFGAPEAPSAWGTEMRAAFIRWIRAGGGFVAVHAGSSVFYDWPEFQALAGTSWGGTSRHGRQHHAELTIVEPYHPVLRGLGSLKTHDEFWEGGAVAAGARVLATVTPRREFDGSGKPEASVLAASLGAGRGFTLLLGHDAPAMRQAAFRNLLRRGTEWAATGAVTDRSRVPAELSP